MGADPSLVGRDTELATLAGLVGARRVVTVTGVGGVGKTRLALAVAGRAQHAVVCLLARQSRPDQVPAAVAESLGYPSWDAALVGLADRSALLVLDNCEHLLDAAADTVELLLATAPGVSVLATSREPLEVPDEHVLRLAPLAVGNGNGPVGSPAVELFLARAAAAGSTLELDADGATTVVELCRRLDGLPLAIELAAARTPTLTPAEILAHLDRRLDLLVGHRRAPARHRSLEAMVDWSYERLEPATARFFDRLGVAEGRFTAEMAHAVGGEPGDDLLDVIDHLDRLVARSLVQVHRRGGRTWYSLLETIRAYARAKLVATGEFEAVTTRCVDCTVVQCRDITARSWRSWSAELAATADALRHDVYDALGFVLDHDERPDRAFALYGILWCADVHHGRARPVAEWGERLLARWPDPALPGWSEAAGIAATAHVVAGDRGRGAELARAAVDAADGPSAAFVARRALLLASLADGEGDAAVRRAGDALAHAQDLSPWRIELVGLRAIALAVAGRDTDAVAAARAAHADAAEMDGTVLAAWCALVHGHVLALRDPEAAQPVLTEVVARSEAVEYPLGRGLGNRALGVLDLLAGRYEPAARSLLAALDDFVRLGDAHVRTTLRAVAALATATGHGAAVSGVRAAADASTAADLSDLLARATLDRRLVDVPDPGPAPTLPAAVARARDVLATIAEPVNRLDTELVNRLDTPAPAFRREGVVWSLTYDGATVRLPDAKGFHDLAALLASAGREIHCAELMGVAVEVPDTGPVLDAQARWAYEARIVELQGDLVEAEDAHDREAADRARLEMDLLVEHLTAATGLGGRSRRPGGSNERARSAVRWRIRAAIDRIEDSHPALSRHLRAAVRTGTWCSYQPGTPIEWQL
jgi:predicted ATPase